MSGATVADQDFIAFARQDIPTLLAEVRALRAQGGVTSRNQTGSRPENGASEHSGLPQASRVPPVALLLGLAGVLPFAWGALGIVIPSLGDWSLGALGPRYTGRTLLLLYGTIILSFMSGTVWGFATRAEGRRAALLYGLSTLPALWALAAGFSALALALGFALLLILDARAKAWGLAPPWWLRLRVLLTVLVVACLLAGVP